VKMARSTSVRAALMGFPASCARVRANSSLRSSMGGGNPAENALAFEGGQPPGGAESLDGCDYGGLGMLVPALQTRAIKLPS